MSQCTSSTQVTNHPKGLAGDLVGGRVMVNKRTMGWTVDHENTCYSPPAGAHAAESTVQQYKRIPYTCTTVQTYTVAWWQSQLFFGCIIFGFLGCILGGLY